MAVHPFSCKWRLRVGDLSPVSIQTQSLALRALHKRKPQETQASACVGKQPIMVATTSTEHSYWLALAFVARNFHATNVSASQ